MLFNLTRLTGWLLALLSLPAHALTIFACQPDWASLAKVHAPEAEVFSATTAFQDPHFIQARPSLINKMHQADLVICSGAELEVGWLPELQRQSRNAKVSPGGEGLFFTTDYVAVLDKHDHVDRSMGDVHAGGNPHVQFAVADMINISQALSEKLQQLDPKRAAQYLQAGEAFRQRWAAKMLIWKNKALSLKGKKVVGYHATYRYLFAWLGMTQVADLEPKPGVSPTTAHLTQLAKLDPGNIYAIVYASHQNSQAAKWLAGRTQLPMIVLAQSVGGNEQSYDLITLIDNSINLLLAKH
ncbi:zinc ABC transporter substrate-binding protein [Motilimonas sp. 1_MG-2023]|uniref:metal ABC transporter solute-binding protein, Zn/Mn family n=1 Tax=Motilimonas sp. 1_MG-2023 TaxID=3062672 RepID=UPI0026E426A8|nr:zinc ABC transporter substrate-binding protein [Motilimonas sp. 1_MG-2023]MDO6526548.1 zinc ABC transporter substrate-binding protein [Motilimonas sp. 1_MG-2023]